MQVSPPKQGSARRDRPALSSAVRRSACTTMPTSERMVVAATQVSPEKQMSSPPRRPSLLSSAALMARGKRSHITTSSEDAVVFLGFLDLVDFLVDFFAGMRRDSFQADARARVVS